jgi:hypothetical protein
MGPKRPLGSGEEAVLKLVNGIRIPGFAAGHGLSMLKKKQQSSEVLMWLLSSLITKVADVNFRTIGAIVANELEVAYGASGSE